MESEVHYGEHYRYARRQQQEAASRLLRLGWDFGLRAVHDVHQESPARLGDSVPQGYKLAIRRGHKIEKLPAVVDLLLEGSEFPESLCDHELKGKWKGHRELHIEDDWLLVYKKKDDILVLELTRTSSMMAEVSPFGG